VGGPTYCCGIVHHRQGDVAAGEGMANRTLELFKRYEPDEVVMWCPSCIYFYDEVMHARVPYRVRHTTEFLLAQVPRMAFTARVERTVAVHAHGVGEARLREARACRELLAAAPGVRVVPLEPEPRFGRSCAPAIPIELGQDVWDGLVRDEIERARAAGADTLAGIYHGCQRMICGFEAEGRITIEHYLSVFARALGIEFEDQFKKYRLWGDPDRVLEDMAPCQQANGVDPEKARALVMAMFARRSAPGGAATAS
jgi:heterodisulfide reductase subunit D